MNFFKYQMNMLKALQKHNFSYHRTITGNVEFDSEYICIMDSQNASYIAVIPKDLFFIDERVLKNQEPFNISTIYNHKPYDMVDVTADMLQQDKKTLVKVVSRTYETWVDKKLLDMMCECEEDDIFFYQDGPAAPIFVEIDGVFSGMIMPTRRR